MNWGKSLIIVFIIFMSGIGYLAYRTTQTNFDLVENDYYKQELSYQQKIDKATEANNLSEQISIVQTKDGIKMQLPVDMKDKKISGEVWFYCAYDKNRDKKFNIETDTALTQFFSNEQITPGNYTVKINWNGDQKSYYSEKHLTIL